jgi:DNA-binding MarR family transcriptional regulator
MNARISLGNITPSICEEAFERFTTVDVSLSEQIKKNGIQVREFIILSFVCDQNELSVEQISSILSLSCAKTKACVCRLEGANLVEYTNNDCDAHGNRSICPTPSGRSMALRVHHPED